MIKYHTPVLLNECLNALNIKNKGIYVDTTFGGGGHSRAILDSNPSIRLFSFDQDNDSIENAIKLQNDFPARFVMIQDNFANLWTRLSLERVKKIDGILFDLGVSSHQINDSKRGFSFSYDGALDMRMDISKELSAYEVINKYPYEKLLSIFYKYGEEKESNRIARGIILERQENPIKTTLELGTIIDNYTYSRQKLKAKARIFQALRIYVNSELESLERALNDAIRILKPGGRIVVISYHSLEDRIVKNIFREQEKDCLCPQNFLKCVCSKQSYISVLTKKPVLPSKEEIAENSRARSAKMRFAERKDVA
ncbi:MAG: 16S rRNA (cytosine(1402)-N(4))-methyltransferase RsmH [Candidatus Cloacimonetes bacterium]|nr:16S rRNA (cytosine(1402)-N(4))-methyltransferase RsmH [Candidatus Cloacimonadota bacterium]